ncbi:MAG: hypothetical protein ABSG14_06175 [Verrucomicrobiia bacterium]
MDQVNSALLTYSDKDWNYSRIYLITKPLETVDGPYVLKIEVLDQTTTEGRNDLRSLTDEVKWGDRHSSELGLLEVVSLRINKALLEVTSNDYWHQKRPVIRIIKKESVDRQDTTHAIWYHITEVTGEDFDNR